MITSEQLQMSQTLNQLKLEICERRMIALQYYDEAQRIQQQCRLLPISERRAAMNEVYEMQARAVSESERILSLERELATAERTETGGYCAATVNADESILTFNCAIEN